MAVIILATVAVAFLVAGIWVGRNWSRGEISKLNDNYLHAKNNLITAKREAEMLGYADKSAAGWISWRSKHDIYNAYRREQRRRKKREGVKPNAKKPVKRRRAKK